MNLAGGMAPGAVSSELSFAPSSNRAFGHDAARGIPGTQEQDAVLARPYRNSCVRHSILDVPQHETAAGTADAQHDSATWSGAVSTRGITSLPNTVLSPKV